MDDDEIRNYLSNQGVGVLGLPTGRLPYMVPLSYGYDGESNLYFTYVVGDVSQKALLSEETAAASFLVYDARSDSMWSSVSLEGTLSRVPEQEWDSLWESIEAIRRPDALERASEDEEVQVYRFEIQTETGIRHAGLPPDYPERIPIIRRLVQRLWRSGDDRSRRPCPTGVRGTWSSPFDISGHRHRTSTRPNGRCEPPRGHAPRQSAAFSVGVDAIGMETRCRPGIQLLPIGSVAERVVLDADRPVRGDTYLAGTRYYPPIG